MSTLRTHLFYLVAPDLQTVLGAAIAAGLLPEGATEVPRDEDGSLDNNATWEVTEDLLAARGVPLNDQTRAVLGEYPVHFTIAHNEQWATDEKDADGITITAPSGVTRVNLKVTNLPDLAAQLLTSQLEPLLMDRATLEAQRGFTVTDSADVEVVK